MSTVEILSQASDAVLTRDVLGFCVGGFIAAWGIFLSLISAMRILVTLLMELKKLGAL